MVLDLLKVPLQGSYSVPAVSAFVFYCNVKVKVKAKTTEEMMCGVINVLHGWEGDANESLLTELEPRDPVTGYTEMRALACRIRKSY
jgi:hypothetical protein